MSETYRDVLEVTPTDGRGGFVSANDPDYGQGDFGVAHAGGFIVLDTTSKTLHVIGPDGSLDRSVGKVPLPGINGDPTGLALWESQNALLVLDDTDQKAYAYSLLDLLEGMASRIRDLEFNLAPANDAPLDLAIVGDNAYVLDSTDDRVYCYNSERAYDASASFNLSGSNNAPLGIAVVHPTEDTSNIWVLQATDIHTYQVDGTSIMIHNLNALNQNAKWLGVADDGSVFIADSTDKAIYAYSSAVVFDAAGTVTFTLDKRVAAAIMATADGTAAIIAADSLGQARTVKLKDGVPLPIRCTEWRATDNAFAANTDFFVLFGPEDGRSAQRV